MYDLTVEDCHEYVAEGVIAHNCDPSATKYWAIQHWLINHDVNARALMQLVDRRMEANQLLDWNGVSYTGVLEDMANAAPVPVTHIIFETNAMARHFNTTYYTKQWRAGRNIAFRKHETTKNKHDPQYGLSSLIEPYRSGWYDLPFGDVAARAASHTLADQLTGFHDRDDQLMANWFCELFIHKLAVPKKPTLLPRASWQRRRSA